MGNLAALILPNHGMGMIEGGDDAVDVKNINWHISALSHGIQLLLGCDSGVLAPWLFYYQ